MSKQFNVTLFSIFIFTQVLFAQDWPTYSYPFDDFTPGPASMSFMGIALINGVATESGDIIAVFDENSNDFPRWHTGHILQQENYKN